MGRDFQVKIPMISYGIGSSGSGSTIFSKTITNLDDGDYDGATYYFEINCWNTHATNDYEFYLINESDTVLATILIPALTGSSISLTRFRSTAFTPESGAHNYRVRLEQTVGSNDTGAMSCFIIIDQVNATKTRTPIHGCFRMGGTSQDTNGYVDAVGSPFGDYTDIPVQVGFTKDDSWFGGYSSLTWEMDVVARSNTGAGGDVEILNREDTSQVGTLNFTTGAIENKILDITASGNWGDGSTIYNWRHRKITSGSFFTYRCLLYAKITGGIEKIRLHHAHARGSSMSETGTHEWRELYEISKFESGTTLKMGIGGFTFNVDPPDITAVFRSYGTTDGPGSTDAADIIMTGVGITSFGIIDWVEAPIDQASLLTDGDRYGVRTSNVTSTSRMSGMFFMLFDVSGPGVSVADDMDNWADSLEDPDAPVQLSSSAAEDMDGWADALTINKEIFLGSLAAEDMDNWADSVAFQNEVFLRANVADDLNNWSDGVGSIGGRFFGQDILVLADIFLDTGRVSVSNIPIRHPTRYYEGRVTNFANIVRSIPVPSGLSRIGDASLTLADTDQKFRKLFALETPKKRIVEIRITPEGEPFSLAQLLYRGEIVNITFPEGLAIVELADITFDFLRDEIPTLVTTEWFLNLPENVSEVFAPIVIGEVFSATLPFQGILKCPHVDTVNHRYLVARHHVESVATVYRKKPGEELFSIIFTGFGIVEVATSIDGVLYQFTYIQFFVAQEDGTEVRADVKGWTVDDTSETLMEEDPTRNIRNYLTRIIGLPDDNTKMDIIAFNEVEAKTTALLYKCAGVIEEVMTHGAALSRIYSSFNIDFFQNKDGLVAVALVTISDPLRPLYGDTLRILEETVDQTLADPVYNKIRYQFHRNFADNEWGFVRTFLNETDQIAIGEDIELPVELWFVRDTDTALKVASDISSYFDLTSFRISLDLPAPWVVDSLELARLIGITHYGGIEQSGEGYVNQEVKILALDLDVNNLTYRVDAIIRRAIPLESQGVHIGWWANNSITGPYMPRTGTFFGVFLNETDRSIVNVLRSEDFGLTWVAQDIVNRPNLTDTIVSFDSYWDEGFDNLLEIATQEDTTGRVAYHRFDMIQNLWLVTDEEVVATPGAFTGAPFVSITKTRQSKKIAIFYKAADKVGDSDPFLQRQKTSIKPVGGSWSAPVFIGDDELSPSVPAPFNYRGNRVVAGKEDLLHYFYMMRGSLGEGYFTSRIEDWHTTIDNNQVKGADKIRFNGNVVYYHSTLPYGGYAAEVDADGEVLIDLPVQGFFGRTSSFPYTSSTQLEAPPDPHLNVLSQPEPISLANSYQGEGGTDGSTRYTAAFMFKNFEDNSRHIIWPGVASNGHVVHKAISGNAARFAPWSPPKEDELDEKAGPTFVYPRQMQKMSARMYTLNGVNYIAYFLHGAVTPDQSAVLVAAGALAGPEASATFFRWIALPQLPDPAEYDMDAFVQQIADAF